MTEVHNGGLRLPKEQCTGRLDVVCTLDDPVTIPRGKAAELYEWLDTHGIEHDRVCFGIDGGAVVVDRASLTQGAERPAWTWLRSAPEDE